MRKGESRSDLVKLPIPVSVRLTANCEKLKPISGSREVVVKTMIFRSSNGMDRRRPHNDALCRSDDSKNSCVRWLTLKALALML